MSAGVNPKTKYLAIGSNSGDRLTYLERALNELSSICEIVKVSPIYETKALLPEKATAKYDQFFLNLVIEIKCNDDPLSFLHKTQEIEHRLDRKKEALWAPRTIDIDILSWDNLQIKSDELTLPHPDMLVRSFVLDPLKDINPLWLNAARKLRSHSPAFMKIYNLTPDSFSDGNDHENLIKFETSLQEDFQQGVAYVDLGAESTRPGATTVDTEMEWERLEPYLNIYQKLFHKTHLKPKLSVDTYKAVIAERAIEYGAHLINDVSGLSDPKMLELLKKTKTEYVLMHNLGAPANKHKTIQGCPIEEISSWLLEKLELLQKNQISLKRIIFDPGIGFGKTPFQSVQILRQIDRFQAFPVRLMVGHSRKSFLETMSSESPEKRDAETLGVSLNLIEKGVDLLRVHNTDLHLKTLKGWQYVSN